MNATAVNLEPLMSVVVWPILGALVTVLAGWLALKANQWLGLKSTAMLQGTIEDALNHGLQAAQAKVATLNMGNVEVQSAIVAAAGNYVVGHVADTLKAVGIDPTTPAGLKLIAEKVEARLAPAVLVAASSKAEVSVATAATIANPSLASPAGPPEPPQGPALAANVATITADAKKPVGPA